MATAKTIEDFLGETKSNSNLIDGILELIKENKLYQVISTKVNYEYQKAEKNIGSIKTAVSNVGASLYRNMQEIILPQVRYLSNVSSTTGQKIHEAYTKLIMTLKSTVKRIQEYTSAIHANRLLRGARPSYEKNSYRKDEE